MGKLAERLADPDRSGVYRIETTEALEEAVALNAFELVHVAYPQSALHALDRLLAQKDDGRVLLLTGFAALAGSRSSRWTALVDTLIAAAAECRAAGLRFFVVFLDAEAALPLAPLYHWQGKPEDKTHEVDEPYAARG